MEETPQAISLCISIPFMPCQLHGRYSHIIHFHVNRCTIFSRFEKYMLVYSTNYSLTAVRKTVTKCNGLSHVLGHNNLFSFPCAWTLKWLLAGMQFYKLHDSVKIEVVNSTNRQKSQWLHLGACTFLFLLYQLKICHTPLLTDPYNFTMNKQKWSNNMAAIDEKS